MAKKQNAQAQVKELAQVNETPATPVIDAQASTQDSSVFSQPVPNHLALVPTPTPSETELPAPTNRKYPNREAWGNAALSMIYKILLADKMEGDRIVRKAFTTLPELKHVLVSANAPLAKRSKVNDTVSLVGRTAEIYPPEMSEDGTTWQIFLASQIDGDENYLNLLFGQVMRSCQLVRRG